MHTPTQGALRDIEYSRAIHEGRNGILRRTATEKAPISHPFRLHEFKLPPKVSADKSENQSPIHAVVFKHAIGKRRAVRRSSPDHAVDSDHTRHVAIARVHPTDM